MNNRSLLKILYGVLMSGLLVSCMGMEESDPSSLQMPEVKTFEVKDNGSLIFELTASVDKSLSGRIAECGFYYGNEKSMSGAEKIECKMLGGTFSADITLHEYGETFYACSYISNGTEGNKICSEVKSITVKELEEYVEFGEVTVNSYDMENKVASVNVQCNVKDGVDVTLCGLCYGTSRELTVNDIHVKDKLFTENVISVEIPDCNIGDTYYVRPYLYDGEELTYGDVVTLNVIMKPSVTTSSVSNISDYSATCGGNVTDDGGAEVTAKGIVWSTSENPTVDLSTKIDAGKGAGEFSSSMTGLLPGTKYYVRAYATNSVGTSYGAAKEFVTAELNLSNVPDLSLSGSSNCYIVSKAGINRFPAVKGNSSTSVGSVNSVEVLWETFGTSTAPKVGDLIKTVFYNDGCVVFQTADTFKEGNAVIAAKDASGTILWSWHIWLTDEPGTCSYQNVDPLVMDRNLGATSATPGDVGALGLLYQWGRKDPFLGSSSISDDIEAKSTISWPSAVSSSSSRGTISYATEHPTTFITYNDANYDWYYSGSSSTDNTRWQSTKTIYDPCPAGWRVPDGGSNGVWNKAGFDDQSYDSSDEGMLFGSGISSPSTWYPAAGFRDYNDGALFGVGYYAFYWSVTPYGNNAYGLGFGHGGYVNPTNSYFRAGGQSVRCLKQGEMEPQNPDPVEITYTVVGTLADAEWTNNAPAGLMAKEGDLYVAKNIPFVWNSTYYGGCYNVIEFKIVETGTWDGFAYPEYNVNQYANAEITVQVGGENIAVNAPEGNYDVYFDKTNLKVWVMESGFKPGEKEPLIP